MSDASGRERRERNANLQLVAGTRTMALDCMESEIIGSKKQPGELMDLALGISTILVQGEVITC